MESRILVIEPNPADAHWIELMLSEFGVEHDTSIFPSAVSALASLHDCCTNFDIVILNFALPFLDLDEALSRLRELSPLQSATFAVTVSLDVERDQVPPGICVLIKPVDVDQLRTIFVVPGRETASASQQRA